MGRKEKFPQSEKLNAVEDLKNAIDDYINFYILILYI